MRLTYTAEARMELVDAASYYRSCHKELGREFKQRVEAAENDIRASGVMLAWAVRLCGWMMKSWCYQRHEAVSGAKALHSCLKAFAPKDKLPP